MSTRIIDKVNLGPIISPRNNQNIPIHNWYSFKHGFSRELAVHLIKNFGLSEGACVLDPFCGGGTTLLTCKELGINARGFDILPFSVFLSRVKIGDYEYDELLEQLDSFKKKEIHGSLPQEGLPDIPLIKKAFSPAVELALITLKARIDSISAPQLRQLSNLAFLSILESVSNTSKSGGFLRIVKRDVSPTLIEELFFAKISTMLNDVKENNEFDKKRKVSIKVEVGDARKLITRRKFDAVITSPPYPNRHDYSRIYSLEMIFDFVSTNQELKNIRYDSIRSHVEARKKHEALSYRKPTIIDTLIKDMKTNGLNNLQITDMVEGYFEDMYLALSEIHRCLRKGGKVGMVISNVRFAGVNILVDEILSEIGEQVGLAPEEIWAVRYKGNSSQQMKNYERKPSRESIIIWGKHVH